MFWSPPYRPSWGAFVAAQACVLSLTATIVYYEIFSWWATYDDEGFMMMTIQHLLDGHLLYDEIRTAYGPAYYLYKWLIHDFFGVGLTHDLVRMNAGVFWLLTSICSAAFVFRLTRSIGLALAAHILVVFHLKTIAGEPGHPQEMAGLLVSIAVLVASGAGRAEARKTILGLGFLVGILAMVKVNLGLFAGAAIWMAMISASRAGRVQLMVRILSAAAIVVLPLVLTRNQIQHGWSGFTATCSMSILAVLIVSLAGAWSKTLDLRDLSAFVVACLAGVVGSAIFPLVDGTSLAGLVNLLIVAPQKLAGAFGWPPQLYGSASVIGTLSIVTAAICAWLFGRQSPEGISTPAISVPAAALLKFAFAICVIGASWQQQSPVLLGAVTPFLWVILLPDGRSSSSQTIQFPRLALAWMAVLQPLQAYPVAGSQKWFGTFLYVLCAMVALGDVFALLRSSVFAKHRSWIPTFGIALCVVLLVTASTARLNDRRSLYDRLTPLRLPGAERIRVIGAQARDIRALVSALREKSDTFLTYPGFNSLYFWAGKTPPTLDVLSHTMTYSDERRSALMGALLAHSRPYVVSYQSFGPRDQSFMARIHKNFAPSASIGRYQVFTRRK